ncbi:hypothetical protein SNE40_015112 [Patella caerulea]
MSLSGQVCFLMVLITTVYSQVLPPATFTGGPGFVTNSQTNPSFFPNPFGQQTTNQIDPLTLLLLTRGEGGIRRLLPYILNGQSGQNNQLLNILLLRSLSG